MTGFSISEQSTLEKTNSQCLSFNPSSENRTEQFTKDLGRGNTIIAKTEAHW